MLTLEDKIKMYIKGVSMGVSENAGCNDGESRRTKQLIRKFFEMSDEDFTKYCNEKLVSLVAYGGQFKN